LFALKLSCDERFTHAFTECGSVFKVITLVWVNQRNLNENVTACSKRMRKTLVATQLKTLASFVNQITFFFLYPKFDWQATVAYPEIF